jgi:hypothetical protein
MFSRLAKVVKRTIQNMGTERVEGEAKMVVATNDKIHMALELEASTWEYLLGFDAELAIEFAKRLEDEILARLIADINLIVKREWGIRPDYLIGNGNGRIVQVRIRYGATNSLFAYKQIDELATSTNYDLETWDEGDTHVFRFTALKSN